MVVVGGRRGQRLILLLLQMLAGASQELVNLMEHHLKSSFGKNNGSLSTSPEKFSDMVVRGSGSDK